MYMNKLTHIIDVYIYIQISEHIIFLRCKENKYRRLILFILYIAEGSKKSGGYKYLLRGDIAARRAPLRSSGRCGRTAAPP